MSASASLATRLQHKTVAVVGAGLAGLRAASALQSAGARVCVVEARDAAGGKVSPASRDGFQLDRALQVLSYADTHLQRFAADAGVIEALLPLRPIVTSQLQGGRIVAADARSLWEIARTPGVSWRDRARLLRLPRLMRRYAPLLDPARPARAEDLDYRSVADFARLYFGRSVLERFVAPRITAETLGDEHELSRAAFLLHWAACEEGQARLGVAGAGLGVLAEAAAAGLDVRLGLRAQQVKELREGRFALECSGAPGSGGDEVFEVDGLVLALPAVEALRVAASLVVPAERDFLAGVRFGPRVTLDIATERPLTGLPELVRIPHVEHRPVEVLIAEPGVPGGRAPEGRGLITLSATQRFAEASAEDDEERVVRALVGSLEPLFPRLGECMRFTRLHRDPQGVPRFEVGAYRALARFERVQRDRRALGRRLYFAGDYLVGPRFEDAVVSGARAAAAAIAGLAG